MTTSSPTPKPLNVRHALAQIIALANARPSSADPDIEYREQKEALQAIAERAIRAQRSLDLGDGPALVDVTIFDKDAPVSHALREHARLRSRVAELEAKLAEAIEQRDLAIAHDRQPYPTAWAYEQACRTRDRYRAERDEARRQLAVESANLDNLREAHEQACKSAYEYRDELRSVRHDLEHVAAERDAAHEAHRRLAEAVRAAMDALSSPTVPSQSNPAVAWGILSNALAATETDEPAPARVPGSTEPQPGAETALTAPTGQPPAYYVPADVVEGQQAEIARLRAEVKRLSARVREWEAVNADLAERCDSGDIPVRLGERHCDVINDPGGDELDEALTGAMSAIEWAANHISLLRTQLAELQEQHDNAMAALDALPSSKGEFAEIIAPLAEWGPPTGPDSVRRRTAEDIAYRAYVLGKRQASDGWDEAQNEAKRLEAALATAERERDALRTQLRRALDELGTTSIPTDEGVRWLAESLLGAREKLAAVAEIADNLEKAERARRHTRHREHQWQLS